MNPLKIASNFYSRLSYDFSSLQCDLPNDIAEEIYQWGKKHIPDSMLTEDGREDRIHITVKYGIHTIDATSILDLLRDYGPIKIRLGKISLFDSEDSDVVKIEIESDDLCKINSYISENFDVTDTHPEYIPHVTVAYVQKGLGSLFDGCDDFNGREIELKTVTFSGHNNSMTVLSL
jgi:2'-5' RNA ligase